MNIMVVKQGGIGDVLLVTPVLKWLKEHYAPCHLTLMVFPNAVDLVEGLPFVDEVFSYDKKKQGFLPLWRKFRGKDMALFFDLSYRPALAAAFARVPIRMGLRHKRGFWLTHPIEWRESMDSTYEPYVFGEMLEESLGLSIPREALSTLYVSPAIDGAAKNLREKLRGAGLTEGESYFASSPVTAFFLKNWPIDRWEALYQRLYETYGIKTAVFGTGEHPALSGEGILDLWGKLTLREVGALIKGARLLVNGDSMPIHLAAATGTPCIILQGFSDPERWRPRRDAVNVRAGLPCSPCDGYHGTTCQYPRCMDAISVEQAAAACSKMLSATEGRGK